ncbi:hypothetical protein [Streptomyces sp. ODS05-4]|uniref:hypothetical protein n=1 Tax=Streptomyces sp. ODS05-4 TaxID=2944939 RepID=UPI002108C9D5|nr:hypothetical protein [Streptomyces sp. ODS05-4]
MLFTFVGDWANPCRNSPSDPFVIVVEGTEHVDALLNAARVMLERFPILRDFMTEEEFWLHNMGAVRFAEFYGDKTTELVHGENYLIIRE